MSADARAAGGRTCPGGADVLDRAGDTRFVGDCVCPAEAHGDETLSRPTPARGCSLAENLRAPVSLTRRRLVGLTAAGLAAAAAGTLAGCSNGASDGGTARSQGFAADTEIAGEAVTVYVVADANLKRSLPGSDVGRVEDYFKRYQEQAGREQVTFAVKYKTAAELEELAAKGFDEGTAVIALDQTIEAACGAGTLYGGDASTSVRTFAAQLTEQLVVIRKEGGDAEMPKSDTLSGDDSADGQISRMQHLADFDGKIAVAAEELTEGMLANRVLARWGYYSDDSGRGGKYSKDIAGKLVVCKTVDELVSTLARGKCQLAFGVESMLWGDFDGIEEVYQPSGGTLVYSGASIPDADNDAVARDFLEFITRCV